MNRYLFSYTPQSTDSPGISGTESVVSGYYTLKVRYHCNCKSLHPRRYDQRNHVAPFQLLLSILDEHVDRYCITSTSSHHITSHHIASTSSHHIASHHIASHRITSHHIAHHITSTSSHHIASHRITSHQHHQHHRHHQHHIQVEGRVCHQFANFTYKDVGTPAKKMLERILLFMAKISATAHSKQNEMQNEHVTCYLWLGNSTYQ